MKEPNLKRITFFSDFKKFISKGNVVDLAVAVVIGAAFSAIVTSLVNDIIMPLLTWAMGGNGIAGAALVLNGVPQYLADGTINPAAVLWNYGNFIQAIINFLIISLCIFTALRVMMNVSKGTKGLLEKEKAKLDKQLKKGKISAEEAAEQASALETTVAAAPIVETTDDLLREIRDLLKAQQAAIAPDAQEKLSEISEK